MLMYSCKVWIFGFLKSFPHWTKMNFKRLLWLLPRCSLKHHMEFSQLFQKKVQMTIHMMSFHLFCHINQWKCICEISATICNSICLAFWRSFHLSRFIKLAENLLICWGHIEKKELSKKSLMLVMIIIHLWVVGELLVLGLFYFVSFVVTWLPHFQIHLRWNQISLWYVGRKANAN